MQSKNQITPFTSLKAFNTLMEVYGLTCVFSLGGLACIQAASFDNQIIVNAHSQKIKIIHSFERLLNTLREKTSGHIGSEHTGVFGLTGVS